MPDDPRPPGESDSGGPPVAWHDAAQSAEERHASKKQLLESALDRGKTLVRIDARRPGVRVPERLASEHALALNLSWRFPQTEMVLNERGVAATLRFGGAPFRCVLPWASIWGVVAPGSEALHVWPLDLPVELGGPPLREDDAGPPVEPMRPKLSVISEAPAPEPAAAEPSAAKDLAKEERPALPAPEASEAPRSEGSSEQPPAEPSEPASPGSAAQRAPWLRLVR